LEAGKLADVFVLVLDGGVLDDLSLLEKRDCFVAVIQVGIVKAGKERAER